MIEVNLFFSVGGMQVLCLVFADEVMGLDYGILFLPFDRLRTLRDSRFFCHLALAGFHTPGKDTIPETLADFLVRFSFNKVYLGQHPEVDGIGLVRQSFPVPDVDAQLNDALLQMTASATVVVGDRNDEHWGVCPSPTAVLVQSAPGFPTFTWIMFLD
jgi:hypothetical protein